MVHDLWPLLYPKWIPSQSEFLSNFGKDSFKGIVEIVNYFKKIYTKGLILPENKFIKDKLDKSRVKIFYLYMLGIMSLTLKTAQKIVVPSLHTFNEVKTCFPEVIKKVEIVYNFPDPIFNYDPDYPKRNYILHVSKWEPRKNLKNIIIAFNNFCNNNKEFKLILVGSKGYRKYGNDILDFISLSPYKNLINYKGLTTDDELANLYRSAYIFLFPSLYEGFGIPVLEAMATGTPVITSNVTSLPEICNNSALLINPQNINEIVSSIERIITNRALYENYKFKGLKQVKKFDRKSIIERFVSIIQSFNN